MGERRLAAIGVADVVGYSRMMAEDEEGTLAALKAHLNATDPILFNHGGRIVKRTGDGLLFEVPSVVEAVRAAMEIQQMMIERNDALPEGRRMQYRFGVNLGDVIVDDDGDIYGDGVNVAARLEALADPGGICIADSVYRQVAGKIDATFHDLGPVEVKNLPEPIRAWRIGLGDAEGPRHKPTTKRLVASLVVLPFANMSGDPDQEYFADGITEDLTTALSHVPGLAVVSRNSSYAYKGTAMDIREIARELDATHVIEGSVRRAGNRIRITAQLIDADSGHHLWADRFDRELEDVFDLQDEMVDEIAAHVLPTLTVSEGEKRANKAPADIDAWDLLLRARWRSHAYSREAMQEGIGLAEQAVALDPTLADGHADLVSWWSFVLYNGWRIADTNAAEAIQRHAAEAVRLDPNSAYTTASATGAANFRHDIEEAVRLGRRAVSLNPHHAVARMVYGHALLFDGRADAAVDELTEAWRIARHEVWRFHIAYGLSAAHYLSERYESTLAWTDRGIRVADYLQLHIVAAAALARLGRTDQASAELAHLLETRPGMTATRLRQTVPFRRAQDIDHYVGGVVLAGLPE